MTQLHPSSRFVLVGPPGSGKGTQAAWMSACFGIPTISSSQTLRSAVMAGSVAARRLEAVMKSGGLVADEVINQLIFDRLAEPDTFAGFVLDGFPRTAAQAEALDQFVGDPAVVAVVLHVPEIENRAPLDRAACLFPVPDAAITKQPQLQAMRMCLLWRHARTPRR